MKRKAIGKRNKHGVSLAFVGLCAVLLIVLVFMGFQYSMLLGGSRQVRNSVDAAVLNVSKRLPESKVATIPLYKDCADSTGQVGLSNINRVWGKAMLVAANAEAMKANGEATGNTIGGAETAYATALKLNDSLLAKITDSNTLNMYYQDLAEHRGANMLGEASSLQTGEEEDYNFALIGRGGQSNLTFSNTQLPDGSSLKQSDCANNGIYLKGYSALTANGKPFCFTSFSPGGMPCLLPDSQFTPNRTDVNPVAEAPTAIPNAVMATGIVHGARGSLTASASALANPRRSYQLAIPHAFITVRFDSTAKWYVNDKKVKETTYGYEPTTQLGLKEFPLPSGRKINGYASLGNEYNQPSLLQVIDQTPGMKDVALEKAAQRLREISPGYNVSQLKKLFQTKNFDPQVSKYYIYPVYKTADNTDPQIKIGSPQEGLPSWLVAEALPDGLEKVALTEQMKKDEPNYNWFIPLGGSSSGIKKWTEFSGIIYWQPGTGVDQCLGELHFGRTTKVKFEEEPQG